MNNRSLLWACLLPGCCVSFNSDSAKLAHSLSFSIERLQQAQINSARVVFRQMQSEVDDFFDQNLRPATLRLSHTTERWLHGCRKTRLITAQDIPHSCIKKCRSDLERKLCRADRDQVEVKSPAKVATAIDTLERRRFCFRDHLEESSASLVARITNEYARLIRDSHAIAGYIDAVVELDRKGSANKWTDKIEKLKDDIARINSSIARQIRQQQDLQRKTRDVMRRAGGHGRDADAAREKVLNWLQRKLKEC